jgi:Calcineurin-like phosphoesterase
VRISSNLPNTPDPKRPASMKELGFAPQLPVRWFDPRVLAGAGLKVLLSSVLGDYLDKRELQETAPGDVIEEFADRNSMWIDFVADTGDGFDATYTVAWSVSQDSITVEHDELPRGELLVFGGDEVYPTASAEAYENRCIGPYRAALPWAADPTPVVVAIPGNHDWYDGLTSFVRAFTQHRWIGGRRTIQDRSYFAIRLPHGHWLWGVDIQSAAYLDSAQIGYFKNAALKMAAGDRVILCTAMPVWIERHPSGEARNLAFVERELVPPDVEVILTLTGDEHHYARYGDPKGSPEHGGVKVTAGGGGAFLSPTHNLPMHVSVPIHGGDSRVTLNCEGLYPNAKTSRRLSVKALSIGFLNSWFPLVTALVGWFVFAANTAGLRTRDPGRLEDVSRRWSVLDLLTGDFRSAQTAVTFAVLFAALFAFAIPRQTGHSKRQLLARTLMAVVHTVIHLSVIAVVSWMVLRMARPFAHGTAYQLGAAALMGIISAITGSLAVGIYLAGFGWFGRHDNESFSAFRHEGYKNFLRIRVDADGVEVFAIGIERVVRKWKINNDGSWLAPEKAAPQAHLIEKFMLRRDN